MTNKKVMILPSIRTVRQEIEEADEPVIRLEESAGRLEKLSNKVSDQAQMDFVNALRSMHESTRHQSEEAKKAELMAEAAGAAQTQMETEILQMFKRMQEGQPVYPQELAEKLDTSFQRLSDFMIYHIETQFSRLGSFPKVEMHINKRKQMFKEIARIMAGNPAVKAHAETLATKRYDDLLNVLKILNTLSEEYRQRLQNIYDLTEQLEMIKGLNVQKGPGFMAGLFGAKKKEEKKAAAMLSGNDKRKIPVLQNMLQKIHSTTIVAMRGRLREFERERQQLSQDEAEVVSKLRRAPRTNLRVVARAA
jgi:hypothetical protein